MNKVKGKPNVSTLQESAITASTSKDEAMIHILSSGGDMHSEVAKACWPDILGSLTDDEVKTKYKHLRQFAKAVEFAINRLFNKI